MNPNQYDNDANDGYEAENESKSRNNRRGKNKNNKNNENKNKTKNQNQNQNGDNNKNASNKGKNKNKNKTAKNKNKKENVSALSKAQRRIVKEFKEEVSKANEIDIDDPLFENAWKSDNGEDKDNNDGNENENENGEEDEDFGLLNRETGTMFDYNPDSTDSSGYNSRDSEFAYEKLSKDEIGEDARAILDFKHDNEADLSDVEPTNRLAIVSLDWDNIRSSDIFVVLRSFLPPQGSSTIKLSS